jgi:Asp-tRNA(Asn)/Glu-tRNA(Gln) amidotransferase A subunit family amidase
VSLQVLGPRGSDGAVLAAAETIERLVEFRARPVAHLTTDPRS